MKVLVLEDERPAREQLLAALRAWDPAVEVLATLDSVAAAVRWLLEEPAPDLVLADIQLTDGSSLEVLRRAQPRCPVVFVTAYDRYTLEALEAGGIDYVLKPLEPGRVARALDKVVALRAHFRGPAAGARRRVLVRQRGEVRAVPVTDIAWFCTEHRLVFLVERDGARSVVDKTLTELAAELDSEQFFRIGRGWIVAIDAVRGFRSHGKGRLRLVLEPETDREAVVGADRAAAFRAWLDR